MFVCLVRCWFEKEIAAACVPYPRGHRHHRTPLPSSLTLASEFAFHPSPALIIFHVVCTIMAAPGGPRLEAVVRMRFGSVLALVIAGLACNPSSFHLRFSTAECRIVDVDIRGHGDTGEELLACAARGRHVAWLY